MVDVDMAKGFFASAGKLWIVTGNFVKQMLP